MFPLLIIDQFERLSQPRFTEQWDTSKSWTILSCQLWRFLPHHCYASMHRLRPFRRLSSVHPHFCQMCALWGQSNYSKRLSKVSNLLKVRCNKVSEAYRYLSASMRLTVHCAVCASCTKAFCCCALQCSNVRWLTSERFSRQLSVICHTRVLRSDVNPCPCPCP